VAEDEAVPKAVARTLAMFAMNRKGSVRVKITKKSVLDNNRFS
jgi:hypothetical protein